jgi:hypothetical protein
MPDSARQAALRHEPLSRTRQPVAPPCEASGAEAVPFQRVSERKARPSEGAALTPCAAFLRLFAAKSSLLYHPAPRCEALRQQPRRGAARPEARRACEALRAVAALLRAPQIAISSPNWRISTTEPAKSATLRARPCKARRKRASAQAKASNRALCCGGAPC